MRVPRRSGGDAPDTLQVVCPGFEPTRPARTTLKSRLSEGTLAGRPVFAKQLRRPDDPLARYYFERELAMHERFAATPPSFPVAKLVAADRGAGVLVLQRLAGAPLAVRRRASGTSGALGPRTVEALLAMLGRLAAYGAWSQAPRPDTAVRNAMRARLLEDPDDPRGFMLDGIARARKLGILSEDAAARAAATLSSPELPVAFAHGDLLLRNVMADGDHLTFVDWECAGVYPRVWDPALLWVSLPDELRPLVMAAIAPTERPAFLGALLFALAREVKFRRAFGRKRAPEDELTRTLRTVDEELRAAMPRS
jgi:hypothetical protein